MTLRMPDSFPLDRTDSTTRAMASIRRLGREPLRRARYLRDRQTPARWLARSQRRQQLAMLRMAPQPEQMLAERLVACVVYIGRALAEQPLPRGRAERQRRAALHVLGLSLVRTARGLLGLIALGYPDQATMLLRRLLELGVGLRDVLDDDQPGAAHEWLSGRRTKHSKRRLAKYHLDALHQPLSNLLHGGPDAYFTMHRALAGELPTGPFVGAEVYVARLLVASVAAEFAECLLEQVRNAGWSEHSGRPEVDLMTRELSELQNELHLQTSSMRSGGSP
jgi:hypothetical protein